MRAAILLGIAVSLVLAGCATGGADDSATSDSGSNVDAPHDGGGDGCATGRSGPTCQNCAGGFHTCGTSCEQDHFNQPDSGCTLGCANPCTPPKNATSKCTSDGHCAFACNATYDMTDGGCECPTGQLDCNGTCAECCTASDCPSHVGCAGGVCTGCDTNWGDCNKNPSDGCEADFSKEPNCGGCGLSCCGWGTSCCFTDFHGKSCKTSGSSYSCQC